MAVVLRRVLSGRSTNLLTFRSSLRHSSTLSPVSFLVSGRSAGASLGFRGASDHPFITGYSYLNRRGFAKGKKSKANQNDDSGDTVQVVSDIGPTVKSTTLSHMEAANMALSRELSKLRTGRASAGMLDHIIVEAGGTKMTLNRVAVVSVIDAQTLSVTPYDPNGNSTPMWEQELGKFHPCTFTVTPRERALKAVEHAIISSPLGLNPMSDGQRLIAPIPPLTKESMQALCKVVTKSAEDVRQSIRRARQKALDSIKKAASNIPKDDAKRLEKEIEDMTKRFVKSADDMCKAKEKEIAGS